MFVSCYLNVSKKKKKKKKKKKRNSLVSDIFLKLYSNTFLGTLIDITKYLPRESW